jgi:glycosyltransferase involved in cell wall biosynthesis
MSICGGSPGPFRLLFVKENMAWPRSSGHDVHCYYMMRALAEQGHEVSLLTAAEPAPEAIAGLQLVLRGRLDEVDGDTGPPLQLSRLQERFRSYWGIDPQRIRAVARTAEECRADAVVVVGLNVLPYLGAVQGRLRVWYAADEWAWHHLSLLGPGRAGFWTNLKQAAIKGLYERAYARLLDRVWVVSEADRRAMSWVTGLRAVDVLPNGVDVDHYRPQADCLPPLQRSCVFWGRLDFEPNIQALEWFCRGVWPLVRQAVPDARFSIFGFNARDEVRALAGRDGVELLADLPDLRAEVARREVVVLPFISGGGIKNKLLEAAGMAKAVVCTPRACGGLRGDDSLPFVQVRRTREWARALALLWGNAPRRQHLGWQARQWVTTHHSWSTTACQALKGLRLSHLGRREPA